MLRPRFKKNKNDETRRLMDGSESESEYESDDKSEKSQSSWNFFQSCMPPTGNMFSKNPPKKWNWFQSMLDPNQAKYRYVSQGTDNSLFDPKNYFCFHPVHHGFYLTVDDMIQGILYFWNINIQEHSSLYQFLNPCSWNGMSKSEFSGKIKNMVELHLDHCFERMQHPYGIARTTEYILDFVGDAIKDSTSLKTLSLKHNSIQDCESIARILSRNKSITKLDLYGNKINQQGMTKLARALESNSTLTHIDVRHNPFTSSKKSYNTVKIYWNQLLFPVILVWNRKNH